jgi:hypothetical protein
VAGTLDDPVLLHTRSAYRRALRLLPDAETWAPRNLADTLVEILRDRRLGVPGVTRGLGTQA